MEGGHANGSGDDSKGQIHNLRPEGEEISKGDSQYVRLRLLCIGLRSSGKGERAMARALHGRVGC